MEDNIIFETTFEARDYRIRQVTPDDCIVEYHCINSWYAIDDDIISAHVYMLCCLNQQKIINAFGSRKLV